MSFTWAGINGYQQSGPHRGVSFCTQCKHCLLQFGTQHGTYTGGSVRCDGGKVEFEAANPPRYFYRDGSSGTYVPDAQGRPQLGVMISGDSFRGTDRAPQTEQSGSVPTINQRMYERCSNPRCDTVYPYGRTANQYCGQCRALRSVFG